MADLLDRIAESWESGAIVVLSLLMCLGGCFGVFEPTETPSPVLSGHITTDLTLGAIDKPYILRGYVVVDSPHTLIIEPGVTIHGEKSSIGTLIISRGAKIIAVGTQTAPIVFTSDQPKGQRKPGDWGGLVINGNAPINNGDANGQKMGEGNTGWYGGDDPTDNSGTLQYIRVEFAGRKYNPKKQLNGIAFQGVGAGTTVDHIQVHLCKDDGIEFFGGNVCAKYILCLGSHDDSFDWTDGWRGKGQFWISYQESDEEGDKGIEGNNVSQDDPDVGQSPVSEATLYNISLIGNEEASGLVGANFRKGTKIRLYNSIIQEFGTGLKIDADSWNTFTQSTDGGSFSTIRSCLLNSIRNKDIIDEDSLGQKAFLLEDTTLGNHSGNYKAIQSAPTWDFRTTHALLSTLAERGIEPVKPPQDGFFEHADYIGAMGPNPSDDWTADWITTVDN
ncbi:MAG: hypothetical protein GF363_15475 [Chitinivibrionales bacterium]|nr:hypothetical protein [Chitinivibrionales bacterium]